jgi:phosphoribosylformylglycinamidine synthase subunit PurL
VKGTIDDLEVSTLPMAVSLGLSADEYNHVCRKLERAPVFAELGVFSAMFSEHCSYKSSKKFLKRLPTSGKRVIQGPGENAGVLDIGSGYAVAFKMESHNHPSFIEPFQGAATGVGGILRDVFTMGARPIANMDCLFFGSPEWPGTASIVRGVVHGVGHYGNCVGVPTVAGQTYFHPCYTRNPLVNAFTIGLLKKDEVFLGSASGIGNPVMYVGSKTGRDGVHGATMSSKEFSSDEELERPTVQVGDPFTEKLLLEATLEAMNAKLIVGIQDMGAAGLTSSSFEMAYRAGTGMEIVLDNVPAREPDLSAYELLLSESQERMLLVCIPDNVPKLKAIFDKWDLHSEVIGSVTEGHSVKMTHRGRMVINLPVELVTDPITLDRPVSVPSDLKQRWFLDRNRLLSIPVSEKIEKVLQDFSFASPAKLVEQYDSQVGNRTVSTPFEDAAVILLRDIPERKVHLALKADCNPRVSWLSPKEGGKRAVAESAINLATRGAEPIGITDCLNFGSPENPEVLWQFEESIEGISEACAALKIPVVSGNVSFYNETDGVPIYPTPMVGMVGLIEGSEALPRSFISSTDWEIGLIGVKEGGLGGSILASQVFKRDCGQPEDTDLAMVDRTVKLFGKLRKSKTEFAAHDISDGGLLVALLEMVFYSNTPALGVDVSCPAGVDVDRFLFGETIPRVLVAYPHEERVQFEMLAGQAGVPFTVLGVTQDRAEVKLMQGGGVIFQSPLEAIKTSWSNRWAALLG